MDLSRVKQIVTVRLTNVLLPGRSALLMTLIVGILSSRAFARVNHVPPLCAPNQMTLKIQNKANTDKKMMLEFPKTKDESAQLIVKAHQTQWVRVSSYTQVKNYFRILSEDRSMNFQIQCAEGQSHFQTEALEMNANHLEYNFFSRKLNLVITNLFPGPQVVKVKIMGEKGDIQDFTYGFYSRYQTQRLSMPLASGYHKISVDAEARIATNLIGDRGGEIPVVIPQQDALPSANQVYFLIGKRNATTEDSNYLVALSDTQQIMKFREQIAHPELEKIVVGRISIAKPTLNRNFAARDQAPYSWQVDEVTSLADLASIDCDGTPEYVETYIESFVKSRSTICFWSYRVLQELK